MSQLICKYVPYDGDSRSPSFSNRIGVQAAVVVAEPDMTCCEHVRQLFIRCRRLIRAGDGRSAVVIDLRRVTLADTKLIACLVALYQLAKPASVKLELRASRIVFDIAGICRLDWWIERLSARL